MPNDLQEGTKFCCLVSATVNRKENEHGRASFLGVTTGGQGRGWCRRVGGGMGHTQLKTGVQGGHVEHRGETEVKVVQKEESGEGRHKTQKAGGKKKKKKKDFWSLDPSRKSTAQPNQEHSEGLPSNHMYLKKGSIWTQEVDLCNI